MENYLDATINLYRDAALTPDVGLCCTTTPIWKFPGLEIPKIMQEMNYGYGSTISAQDLINNPIILYVGVGGGMEYLQFSYFSRQKGGVVGVDVVEEMLEYCRQNFIIAEHENDWFKSEFVELKKGDALTLPIEDESSDIAAQNCLFNIFKTDDLKKALQEMYRVLKPRRRLVINDPTCEQEMNETYKYDDHQRALCLSGSTSIKEYIQMLTNASFGTVEIRGRRPYRI